MNGNTPERELPLLGGIAAFIRFIEELVSLIAGPLLTVGLGISLVDLLTDGALLSNLPFLLFTWAISQAIGVDAQLVASFDRARIALRDRRPWSAIVLLLLGGCLAYVAWVSAQVFATQQADGVTTTQALAMLGMSHTSWLVQRSVLSVFLVCLSGWNRYHPPAKVRLSVEDELAEIDRKVKIAGANQRLREQQAMGVARMGRGLLAAARGQEQESTPQNDPTGPGSPVAAPPSEPEESEDDDGPTVLPVKRRSATRQLKPAARASVEEKRRKKAFQLLEATPDLSANRLATLLGCRWGKANALRKSWLRSQQSGQIAL